MAKSTTEKAQRDPVETKSEVVSMRQLLECGVHFGHQTKRWDPKMKKYIFTSRNGIHVIDLQQSIQLIKKTYEVIKDVVKKGGTVLFVGTKKQAQEAIASEAERCGMPYVNHRWLGGTLTNYITIRESIGRLRNLRGMEKEGVLASLSNKEQSRQLKKMNRLSYYLEGIVEMTRVPDIVFIVDTKREQIAVEEARKLGVKLVGIIDTNADPTEVDYPIPANDDAIRAIKLLCSIAANAVIEGQELAQQQLVQKDLDSAAEDAAQVDNAQKETKQEVQQEKTETPKTKSKSTTQKTKESQDFKGAQAK